jgi:hypothetical protein
LHGVDQSGEAVFIKPKVVRSQLLEDQRSRKRTGRTT